MGHFEKGRWVEKPAIHPKLRELYEDQVFFIDSLLDHMNPESDRYAWLIRERKRRVELIGNFK